jgi:hypothetical protein
MRKVLQGLIAPPGLGGRRAVSERLEIPLFVDGLPAIPSCHRPVGPKPFTLNLKPFGCRQGAKTVGQRIPLPNPVVRDWPHVQPALLENQEHLGGRGRSDARQA